MLGCMDCTPSVVHFSAKILFNVLVDEIFRFVIQPQDQVAVEGETDSVQFNCSTNSTQPVIFVWEFTSTNSGNSRVIATSGDKYSVFHYQRSSRLQVNDVQPSDAGRYSCRAFAGGENMQAAAVLEILCKYSTIHYYNYSANSNRKFLPFKFFLISFTERLCGIWEHNNNRASNSDFILPSVVQSQASR